MHSLNLRRLSQLFLLIFFGVRFTAMGQKKEVYQDDLFTLKNKRTGEIRFEYKLVDKDTVKNGGFSFRSVMGSDRPDFETEMLRYEGNYKDDRKDGKWKFRKMLLNKIPKLVEVNETDFIVSYQTEGYETLVDSRFTNAYPSGKWEALRFEFQEGAVKDTTLEASAVFNTGKFFDKIKITDHKNLTYVSGEFDSDGMMDKNWEFIYYLNDTVSRINIKFESSRLKLIDIQINEEDFSNFVTDRYDTLIRKEMDYQYLFPVIFLNYPEINRDRISKRVLIGSIQILNDGIALLGGGEKSDLWEVTGGNEPIESPQVNMPYFPLSAEQKERLEELDESFDILNENLTSLRNDAQFSLAKFSNEQIAIYNACTSLNSIDRFG